MCYQKRVKQCQCCVGLDNNVSEQLEITQVKIIIIIAVDRLIIMTRMKVKCVVVGDGNVGKTAMLIR